MKNSDELRAVEARLQANLRKRDAIARLRGVCLLYQRDNPAITVGEALKLDRKARPWAYRSAQ
jgi:hypothetical protein